MVFRYTFPAGQEAPRELLQSHRTAAHIAIKKGLGINLMHTDSQGDTINVVTKNLISIKESEPPRATSESASRPTKLPKSAYAQQRSQHDSRGTHTERLLTYRGQVCPMLIPTSHISEVSGDASLHKLRVSCAPFLGLDAGNLLQLF